MEIEIASNGSFKNSEDWLARLRNRVPTQTLNQVGRNGVQALAANTPKRTGETAAKYSYKVSKWYSGSGVSFYNSSHPETSASVPILIQNGHGTRNGGYVPGYDFINPAMRSVFDKAADDLAKEMLK